MTHKIVWLALGTLAIASCTAILGGVPTTGGTGGAGVGGASATGPGGGNGGTPSATGGSGVSGSGIGGAGGAGGGSACVGKGGACGPNTTCCNALSCTKGICAGSTSSSSSGAGGGGMNCIGCRQFAMGQQGQLCDESTAKLNALIACACTPTTCEQTCGAACNGGVPDVNCESCALNDCPNESNACLNDSGCRSCSQMLTEGDTDANDACLGAAQDDFNAFFNCVCGPMHPCGDLCAGYCGGMGATSSCQSCYSSMTAACGHEYAACTAP